MRTEKATQYITFNEKRKTKNPLDRKVRVISWSILTLLLILKIALIAGAVWLIVSLCSCSTAKSAAQSATAQSEVTTTNTATNTATAQSEVTADSLHRETIKELFRDRSLELTDVTIEYATPRKRTPQSVSHDTHSPHSSPSSPSSPNSLSSPRPAKLTIGKITARENTAATQKAVTDSTAASQKAQLSTNNSQLSTNNQQRTTTWGRAVLALAIILGLLIGYLYHRQKGVNHTA